MKVSAVLNPKLINCNLVAKDKESALLELAQLVAKENNFNPEDIITALTEREKRGPFSVVGGVAIPHARLENINNINIALGILNRDIIFSQQNDPKIRIIILFVIPQKHEKNLYLDILAAFLDFFSLKENFLKVLNCKEPAEVISIFDDLVIKTEEAKS